MEPTSSVLGGVQARLGGWLGDGLPQRPTRLCQVLRPLLNALHGAYLDPLLLSVITLRDSVRLDPSVDISLMCAVCAIGSNP